VRVKERSGQVAGAHSPNTFTGPALLIGEQGRRNDRDTLISFKESGAPRVTKR
jgi:hypothetical protein